MDFEFCIMSLIYKNESQLINLIINIDERIVK